MLKAPFPFFLYPITRPPLLTSYFLFPISYYHLQLPLQVEMEISTEKSKRKAYVFGKPSEIRTAY